LGHSENQVKNLSEKAQKGQPEADKIYAATKSLANSSEMRLSSAIKTAIIKMDTARYQINKQVAEQSDLDNAGFSYFAQTPEVKNSGSQRNPSDEGNNAIVRPKASESSWVDEQALKLLGNNRS
jgi:hypothetical protein